MTKTTVTVVGAGSWGTALAMVLARNGSNVSLWDNVTDHIKRLQNDRENKQYLPGIKLPKNLEPVLNLTEQLEHTPDLVLAVPCHALETVTKQLAETSKATLNICLACKGLTDGSTVLNHELVKKGLGDNANVSVLSGPSFAGEVARSLPTAVTIAAEDREAASHFASLFHCDVFRIYTNDDIVGVQVGGAVKNVMAIAAGIADGLGFGANTRAALITRGLSEIMRLGVALGGKPETFMGLAGLGDLVLTCTDDQSRNRRLGLALAKGETLEQTQARIGQAIEGARTAGEVIKLANRLSIEMPITEQVQNVLSGKISPKQAVQELLSRDPKQE